MLPRNYNFPALVLKELLVLLMAKISLTVESFSTVSEWLSRRATMNFFSLTGEELVWLRIICPVDALRVLVVLLMDVPELRFWCCI